MRIVGWILLIGGLLLCVSVAWAALGFLSMAIGLIALQVAEKKRKRAQNAAVGGEAVDMLPGATPVIHPAEAVAGPQIAPAPAGWAPRYASLATSSYDKEAWRRLVESDPELRQLTSVLAGSWLQVALRRGRGRLLDDDEERRPRQLPRPA